MLSKMKNQLSLHNRSYREKRISRDIKLHFLCIIYADSKWIPTLIHTQFLFNYVGSIKHYMPSEICNNTKLFIEFYSSFNIHKIINLLIKPQHK